MNTKVNTSNAVAISGSKIEQNAVVPAPEDTIIAASPIKVHQLTDQEAVRCMAEKLFFEGEEIRFSQSSDDDSVDSRIGRNELISTGGECALESFNCIRTEAWIKNEPVPRYYAVKVRDIADAEALRSSINVAAILQENDGYVLWIAIKVTSIRSFDEAKEAVEGLLGAYHLMPWHWFESPMPGRQVKLLYLNPDWEHQPLKRIGSIDAADLFYQKITPPKWIVTNLIVEGITLFAGKPKIGKSWWGLDLGIGIVSGSAIFGAYTATQGEVLYLALEDNRASIQGRLRKLCGKAPPRGLRFITVEDSFPRLDKGGIEQLEHTLKQYPKINCIIIDTLQKVKPPGKRNQNAYENDVAAMSALHRLALTHHVAVILIHHMKKGEEGDVFDEVSGSLGITGSADTNIVMRAQRDKRTAVMHITGRAIKEYQELAMKFDKDTVRWTVEGAADQVLLKENRKAIREVVLEAGKALTMKEIKYGLELKGVSLKDTTLKKTVGRMVTDDQLAKVGDDRYSIETGYQVASSSNIVLPSNPNPSLDSNTFTVRDVLGVSAVLPVRGVLPPLTSSIKDRSDSMVSYGSPTIILNNSANSATFGTGRTGKTPRTPYVHDSSISVTDEHRATCQEIRRALSGI